MRKEVYCKKRVAPHRLAHAQMERQAFSPVRGGKRPAELKTDD